MSTEAIDGILLEILQETAAIEAESSSEVQLKNAICKIIAIYRADRKNIKRAFENIRTEHGTQTELDD